ncbi:NAD+ synthase [soil metagenome]
MLSNPQQTSEQLISFIKNTFLGQQKTKAVIAISGGIDSAVSLVLLAKALGSENITALLLPYADQSVEDSVLISQHVGIPEAQIMTANIKPIVDATIEVLKVPSNEAVRLGNLKARSRMLCVFDAAKTQNALVCGTENKSEHYLGYFTRFGDAASDLEPISSLYKSEVRQLAEFLQIPAVFLEKAPSAGLWNNQTDEAEMGFSYDQADQVLVQLIDQQKALKDISVDGVGLEVIQKIVAQVNAMSFKLHVPYELQKSSV